MPGLLGRAKKRVTIYLSVLIMGGVACVAVDRRWAPAELLAMVDPSAQQTPSDLSRDLSAFDTVALRFPAELPDETGSLPVLSAPNGLDGHQFHLFDPNPLTAPPSTGRSEPAPSRDAVPPPSAEIRMASVTPAIPPSPAKHAAPRANGRPNAVLNDAQIATIKKRLKLTPDQEQMWPAVEVALRNMSYSKKPQHGGSVAPSKQLASIDPEGSEVQNLKSAAFPLLMSFNSEQKKEVRSLVQVIGLDKLANQF